MQDNLSVDGRALLDAITAGIVPAPATRRRRRLKPRRRAWSMVETLRADGHAGETLASLETTGLVDHWSHPSGPAVTLSPWGKFVQDVEILERPTTVQEEATDRDELGKRVRVKVAREDVELFWGKEDPSRRRPFRLPRRRREFSTPLPELIPDPGPGPEYLLDDDGEPVQLFAALFTGTGFPVEIDHRLGGEKSKKGDKRAG